MTLEVVESEAGDGPDPPEAVFYYDLGDPGCYLTAERVRGELGVVCDWEPVTADRLGLPAPPAPDPEALRAAVAAQGLLELRLPDRWPPDPDLATRVATYAKGAGKSIAFSLAIFRQAFAGGRALDETTVLLAAAACEMHPTAVLKGAGLRTTTRALDRAGERARAAGVTALPAFAIGGTTLCGPDALDRAIAVTSR